MNAVAGVGVKAQVGACSAGQDLIRLAGHFSGGMYNPCVLEQFDYSEGQAVDS